MDIADPFIVSSTTSATLSVSTSTSDIPGSKKPFTPSHTLERRDYDSLTQVKLQSVGMRVRKAMQYATDRKYSNPSIQNHSPGKSSPLKRTRDIIDSVPMDKEMHDNNNDSDDDEDDIMIVCTKEPITPPLNRVTKTPKWRLINNTTETYQPSTSSEQFYRY